VAISRRRTGLSFCRGEIVWHHAAQSGGVARTDSYNCTSNLMASKANTNTFCYVNVNGCQATISCYAVQAGNTTPFDTWTINHCN
jgi:hypothetical protein